MKRSAGEMLLKTQLEWEGIPFAEEYEFHPDRKWRADFAVRTPGSMFTDVYEILVEVEGGIGYRSRHSSYDGFKKDCEKYAAAAILRYRVIRATTEQVEDGTCLSWIKQALGLEKRHSPGNVKI